MKKSFFTFFFAVLLTSFLSAASLRDGVCVVRANLSSDTKTLLESYRDSMKSQGYSDYAESISNYLKGSFGSGFIYQTSSGKKFIVTNRHVVESAETVTVQFEKQDGTLDEYKELKILAVDIDLDLALIELPSDFKGSPIPVKTDSVNDGDDVWTAGFPGLANNPAWQFGKGSVTNAYARIEKLVSPEITTLIQHSAQVDAGNSGGPLLIKDSSSAYGYSVVGINTWKAYNRENTNFAIPGKAIKSFIDDVLNDKAACSKIEGSLSKFEKAIANDEETFGNMGSFISNQMIASLSSKAFVQIYNSSSEKNREVIIAYFVADPLEGIRYALAGYIWNTFRKKHEPADFTTSEPAASETGYTVSFIAKEKTVYESEWICDQGVWRLADFNGIISRNKPDAKKESGFSFGNNYLSSFYGGVILPADKGFNWDAGMDFTFVKFLEYGFGLSHDTLGSKNFNFINVHLKLIAPLNFGKVTVTPYGLAAYGTYFYSGEVLDFCFGNELGGGIEAGYDTGSCMPFAAVQYSRKKCTDNLEDVSFKNNAVSVNLGLRFGKNSTFKLW